ncbi:MAG: carotenoid oxygenase family protein, partial [Proteobacteria bacterium]|nr:carotenoid oxygenase family protein [Pseudomonadota bacterium]
MKFYSAPEPAPSYARAWETINAESGGWVASANIEGVIPADFSGTFFRNGPGLHKVFDQELVHPIDGDGLICRLSFVKGRVHFSSRFVQTERRREEEAQGRMLFPGQMGSAPPSMLKFKQRSLALLALMRGKTPRIRFRDPSNTNVFYWGGKLLSCYETKLPHELDPFSLDTLGKTDLQGDIDWRNLSAHFRYDPLNRSLVLLSHQLNFPNTPKIKILHYDATWGLIKKDLIEVPGLSYIHDFGMTENYYIVHVTPFVVPNRKLLIRYALG